MVLAVMLLGLVASVTLAYSYYAIVQVQEADGNSYTYLPIIASIDNDYLADNGYIGITGLDTRVLSGSTELKHLVTDDKTLFVAPTVGANSTGNYRYTLNNDDLDSFPVIVGSGGHITVPSDIGDDMQLGDDFEIELEGYVDTDSGSNKRLIYKQNAFEVWVSDDEEISASILHSTNFITARTETYVNVSTLADPYNITVTKPTGATDNDILFTWLGWYGATTIDSVPSGWVLLGEYLVNTDRYALYYKIANSEPASWDWSFGADAKVRAVCSAYYGCFDKDDPIDVVSNTAYRTVDTNAKAASMTVTNSNSPLIFWAGTYYTSGEAYTKPTVPTTDWVENDDDGSTTPDYWTEVCSMIWSSSGATGDIVATMSVGLGTKHSFAVALNPSEADLVTSVAGFSIVDHIWKFYADGSYLMISIDGDTSWDGVHSARIALGVASVPDNANDITVDQNNVMPYFDYLKWTVSDDLIAWYQPISMIIDTNLDDREGTDAGETGTAEEDGIIAWGDDNPAGVTATVGSLVSSSQPEISPAEEEGTTDIVPEGSIPSGGTVNIIKLQDNPLYPVVKIAVEYTNLSEEQVWFILATWAIFVGMVVCVAKVPNHLLLAGTIGLALSGFAVNMGIYQWWMLLIFGFIWVTSLIMERKPVF